MIRRELEIWMRVNHANVVPFLGITYGFGREGNASLVSLWMANGTLDTFLENYDDCLTDAHRLRLVCCGSVLLLVQDSDPRMFFGVT